MAQVKHITKRLPELILPTGYYPLLAVQVGSGEVDERGTRVIKQDFKALGYLVEGTGAQMVFSSISLVLGMNARRNRKTRVINMWLKDGIWGDLRGTRPAEDVRLSNRGKSILDNEL